MRRAGWIFLALALVLVLAGGSTVCAQDGFYVIPFKEKNNGASATVPKTGQTTSYGPRDDGALQKGVAWPNPRFTDHGNGAVTDNLTGLIWTKNANAFGMKTWNEALDLANNLKSGDAGLTDGSKAGDWRLPNIMELVSLIDYRSYFPALPAGHPFTIVEVGNYWSSSTFAFDTTSAWGINFDHGGRSYVYKSNSYYYVWCVRAGP